jgi:class 3 adenylate cyclase
MHDAFPYPLLEDPQELATYRQWTVEVYEDFLALQRGDLSHEAFRERYLYRRAILVLDLTGFTENSMDGQIGALLRIVDAQKICIPALRDHGPTLIRTFADNIVALFEAPDAALDAALEIHRRVDAFAASGLASETPAQCCIGIGYGDVYNIGVNRAMGDEMNRASKLGEDVARGRETLITGRMHKAVRRRDDVAFVEQVNDQLPFGFYRVEQV